MNPTIVPGDTAHSPAKHIDIAGRSIGPGKPTFVIAEIGVNHDGDVQKAIELVRIAAACGADAVKLQIFRATALMHPSCSLANYQKDRVWETDAVDMLRRYELNREDLRVIVKAILEAKLIPLATPFSPNDVDTIAALRLPAIKIASPDLVNRPLLYEAMQLGKPMILSTGAATMEEVAATVGWMKESFARISLLHCISSYPCELADAHLGWVTELDRAFDVPVGFSDHTTHATAGALAVMAGATIVEKHITYDRSARGPDHSASADPHHFERYVKSIREADLLRGSSAKHLLECEKDVRKVSRQSLVVRRTLLAGEEIRHDDLTVQRPGTGVSAAHWAEVIGQRTSQAIPAGSILQPEMLASPKGAWRAA
ncbi:N-acetylneuraminate synthase family protein [Humisphaera borealis]|uniref:N-acetylneuraminate synthase family protein n=1 Tax=Humisphaera borealis TaxID=2807512 RepID=A0A7M2WTY6_9BACT|nr:N-acetylneuraminate synthase family protein [Humisphaera borealis]QOV88978.1 N-acetylneuraminate synthase family protein [Humisphaera borealis]